MAFAVAAAEVKISLEECADSRRVARVYVVGLSHVLPRAVLQRGEWQWVRVNHKSHPMRLWQHGTAGTVSGAQCTHGVYAGYQIIFT